jgi:ADP-ribose diphosphatase
MSSRQPPRILSTRTVARSRLFEVEAVDLQFANGVEVEFERLKGSARGAVLIVPITDDDHVLLIREYACGTERYELGLPKGRIDGDEAIHAAAERELMEEVGYGARQLETLAELTMAPTYSGQRTHVVLARSLYPQRLPGDEPEPLEVVPWPMAKIDELICDGGCSEARSIAALCMMRARLTESASGAAGRDVRADS